MVLVNDPKDLLSVIFRYIQMHLFKGFLQFKEI